MSTMTALLVYPRWWWTARHARRAANRAWHQGEDLTTPITHLATVELPTLPPWRTAPPRNPNNPHCPGCGSTRCRHHREGEDCREAGAGQRPAYAAGRTLPMPGRHDVHRRAREWARSVRLAQLRETCLLAPRAMRELLGRPAHVGIAVGGPLGRLP